MLAFIKFVVLFWPVIAWLWKKLGGHNIWGPDEQ